MTDIDIAIKESKNKENISNGGSMCFDFGDVVLVKYSCPTKYLKNGERSREKSEEIICSDPYIPKIKLHTGHYRKTRPSFVEIWNSRANDDFT